MCQPPQAFLFVEVDAYHLVGQSVEAIFIGYRTLEEDVRRLIMFCGKDQIVVPHTRMHEGIKLEQCMFVGEYPMGYGLFIGAAVGLEHPPTQDVVDLRQEIRVVVVLTCNGVGNETGNAELLKFMDNGGLAAAYATCEIKTFRPLFNIASVAFSAKAFPKEIKQIKIATNILICNFIF